MRNAATRSPLRYGACRHRRGARGAALSLCALLLAVAAMVPVNVNVSLSPCKLGVDVNRSQSYAVAPAVAGASELLAEMAAAAGLTTSEFVTVICTSIAVNTGLCVSGETPISATQDITENLNYLIDAADYPAWDTLSESQQELWGDKQNYDAAKFNSLMAAFGCDEYMDGWYASGGNFEMMDDVRDKLEQIGRIGNIWLDGGANFFSSIQDLFSDTSVIYDSFPPATTVSFDATGIEDWPDNISRNIILNYGNYYLSHDNSNRYLRYRTSRDVYFWCSYRPGHNGLGIATFDLGSYMYGWNLNSDDEPTIDKTAAYYAAYVSYYFNSLSAGATLQHIANSNMVFNSYTTDYSSTDERKAIAIMLRENIQPPDDGIIEDYPESPSDIPDDTETYLPEDGVNPANNWNVYLTQPENPNRPDEPVPRPENPYNPTDPDNPSYQSGTPEWNDETSQNLAPAMDIQFNKLFPFCMIYDLQLFWDRLKSIAGVDNNGLLRSKARSQYELIQLPSVDSAGLEEGMTLDLEPLATLLRYTRPAVFWLLIVGVIMSVIEFWKRILTGA